MVGLMNGACTVGGGDLAPLRILKILQFIEVS